MMLFIRWFFTISFFIGIVLAWRILNNVTDLRFHIGELKAKCDSIERLLMLHMGEKK